MMTNANETATEKLAAHLSARAERLFRAGEYLPGRAHFAEILAERLYHCAVEALAMGARYNGSVGRATLLNQAWRLWSVLANNPARGEGARMLGISLMGCRLGGGSRDVEHLYHTAEKRIAA